MEPIACEGLSLMPKSPSSSSLLFSSPRHDFVEPSKQKRFGFRKRRRSSLCDDNVSVSSLDVTSLQGKKRRLSRVASLASLISPAKHIKRIASQHPLVTSPFPRHRSPAATTSTKRCRQWLDKFPEETRTQLKERTSYWELRRQEAIYELYKGEKYMVKDLELVHRTYQGGLQCLGILQPQESQRIFGPLHTLLPVHCDLREKLRSCRLEDKSIPAVGRLLLEWVPQLEVYVDYCSHLVAAREILESRRARSKELATFLDLCRQSGFSRRLDLWSFLDVPRSKLTKYPLLIKNILKHTRDPHEDRELLPRATERVEEIIRSVDHSTGKAICRHALERIRGIHPQKDAFLSDATCLLCQGELRNNRGTRLHGFLFDTGFVLSRPAEDGSFSLHKRPIPIRELQLADATMKSSSFRSAFSSSSSGRCDVAFCVSDASANEEFVLSTGNRHDHKEWVQKIRSLLPMQPLKELNS